MRPTGRPTALPQVFEASYITAAVAAPAADFRVELPDGRRFSSRVTLQRQPQPRPQIFESSYLTAAAAAAATDFRVGLTDGRGRGHGRGHGHRFSSRLN